ncbi:hypothetical protein QF028_001550 [Neobacillus sp. B4I6]|uniref:hypothetical protein n=1 Tax=Neobacillus sp. B4I6 TaxID=3373925 RepID=UPI003D1B415C
MQISTMKFNIAKKKKKQGSSYKKPMKERFIIITFTLLSAIMFLYSIRFLPTVILNQIEEYKGVCEVFIYDNVRGGGGLQVYFGGKNISFSRQGYNVDQEGNYYCEVEYYRNSEIGKSLKIYDLNDRKLVNQK